MKKKEEHWLDIMPAIPLARGVPVVDVGERKHVALDEESRGWRCASPWYEERKIWLFPKADLRANLDDPMGLSFVIGSLLRSGGTPIAWTPWLLGLYRRAWHTDPAHQVQPGEKLVLAQRTAEVFGG